MKIRTDKNGFEISFAWIFAIIVGAFILFLAIYAMTKLISTEQTISDVKIAEEIGTLLNPLETGFESGKTSSLILPAQTRIYNKCNNAGGFGKQAIRISQQSFGKWTDTNIDAEFENKYIFSGEYEEGKKFYLFSKPFEFPFKVSDVIYLISSEKEYCFIDAPENIKNEISNLNQKNLVLNCTEKSIKVCFEEKSGCDILVNENGKYVDKNGEKVYFEGDALMYAGIFSDKEVYECQVKRLMQRVENLAILYKDKENLISGICDTGLNEDLSNLERTAGELQKSDELYVINNLVENIKEKNDGGNCRLW